MIKQVKFTYSPLGTAFEIQRKTTEDATEKEKTMKIKLKNKLSPYKL